MKATTGVRFDLHQCIERVEQPRMLRCTRCGSWYVISNVMIEMVVQAGITNRNGFLNWVKGFIYCCNNPRLRWVEKTARIINVSTPKKGGD